MQTLKERMQTEVIMTKTGSKTPYSLRSWLFIVSVILLVLCIALSACSTAPVKDTQGKTDQDNSEQAGSKDDKSAATMSSKETNETDRTTIYGKNTESEKDYMSIYEPVIKQVLSLIENGSESGPGHFTGIWERVIFSSDDNPAADIGYVLMDINDDGTEELFIGEDGDIYNGFTCENDRPSVFLEGWARNRQQYIGNSHFINTGSGGASNTIFGEWHLDPGNNQVWDNLYFTEYDDTINGLAIYHNKNGSTDPEKSERLDISEDDFISLMDSYKCEDLPWIPLKEWNVPEELTGSDSTPVDGPRLPFVPQSLSGDVFGVFLGAYKSPRECDPLVEKLENAGYILTPVVYTPDFSELNPEPYYAVTAGLFSKRQDADSALEEVIAAGFKDAYVKYAGEYIGGRYYYTMTDDGNIDIYEDHVILRDVDVSLPYPVGLRCNTDLVVDKNTVFSDSADMQFFGNYTDGMSPYEWIVKNREFMKDNPDKYISQGAALLGIFEVSLDGNKIDEYYGSYWWD